MRAHPIATAAKTKRSIAWAATSPARATASSDNLTADGRFKTGHELREAFSAVLAGTEPNRVILQCGSGVTACHNALALEVAGLHGASLYPAVERVERGPVAADRNRPDAPARRSQTKRRPMPPLAVYITPYLRSHAIARFQLSSASAFT